jgi:uncharacterized protein (TIGR04255 family)
MIARVHATGIPKLTSDQKAILGQTLRALGYKEEVDSISQEWGVNVALHTEKEYESAIKVDQREFKRRAYFDDTKKNVFIFEKRSGLIEFPTTAYTKYEDVAAKIQSVIQAKCKDIPVCKDILVKEISLTYLDMIFPMNGRKISDYFVKKGNILPLSIFGVQDNDDVTNFGSIQVTRLVEKNKRIVISLEQLPTDDKGLPTKVLPNHLVEGEPKFQMPVSVNIGNPDLSTLQKGHYALLTTESGTMVSSELKDLDFKKSSGTIHQETSNMFNDLIDKEVCDLDWEFTTE